MAKLVVDGVAITYARMRDAKIAAAIFKRNGRKVEIIEPKKCKK